jgi:hypothetical protein
LTCGPMIGITITAEAYAAIKATSPADTQTWPTSPRDQGDVVFGWTRRRSTASARCAALAKATAT